MAQQPPVGQGRLIIKAPNHIQLYTPQSVGLAWTSDQPDERPLPDNTNTVQEKKNSYPPWDSNQRSQQALGRRATP
jgi:hypothetical protein